MQSGPSTWSDRAVRHRREQSTGGSEAFRTHRSHMVDNHQERVTAVTMNDEKAIGRRLVNSQVGAEKLVSDRGEFAFIFNGDSAHDTVLIDIIRVDHTPEKRLPRRCGASLTRDIGWREQAAITASRKVSSSRRPGTLSSTCMLRRLSWILALVKKELVRRKRNQICLRLFNRHSNAPHFSVS